MSKISSIEQLREHIQAYQYTVLDPEKEVMAGMIAGRLVEYAEELWGQVIDLNVCADEDEARDTINWILDVLREETPISFSSLSKAFANVSLSMKPMETDNVLRHRIQILVDKIRAKFNRDCFIFILLFSSFMLFLTLNKLDFWTAH